jgi:hypothetical protein
VGEPHANEFARLEGIMQPIALIILRKVYESYLVAVLRYETDLTDSALYKSFRTLFWLFRPS